MASIIDNSNHLIKDIYEKCIVDGEIHIFRNNQSLNEILQFSKKIINKHFITYKIHKYDEQCD